MREDPSPVIKSHKELAALISGKRVIWANSLGKDSALVGAWLSQYAKPAHITSLFFRRFTVHPEEDRYIAYLKQKFPQVEYVEVPDPNELTMLLEGIYQPPDRMFAMRDFEYEGFSREHVLRERVIQHRADYICDGRAGYEGLGRAQKFHKSGLVDGNLIFPLGLMKKKDITELIKKLGLKINPTYKYYGHTFDEIAYYRMRKAMKASPEFEAILYRHFPLLKLDKFRWEHLFHGPGRPRPKIKA